MRMGRYRKLICILLIVGLPLALTGCFGSFSGVHRLENFNKNVREQEKWRQEALFLAILAAYPLAWIADGIIFNPIEFWYGKNPIADESTRVTEKPTLEHASAE